MSLKHQLMSTPLRSTGTLRTSRNVFYPKVNLDHLAPTETAEIGNVETGSSVADEAALVRPEVDNDLDHESEDSPHGIEPEARTKGSHIPVLKF